MIVGIVAALIMYGFGWLVFGRSFDGNERLFTLMGCLGLFLTGLVAQWEFFYKPALAALTIFFIYVLFKTIQDAI